MDRRRFIESTFLYSIGALTLPSFVLNSCRKETLFEEINFNGKVIIIGAGAAGLYAGYLLKKNNIDFEILEANANYGGRLGKVTGFCDFPIDTGAQWLHGKNNVIADFIAATNTKITLDDTDMMYWFKGQLVSTLDKDPNIFEEDDLPDVSFKQFAHDSGFSSDYDYIIENMAGDQGASANDLSAFWNNQEEMNWSSGDDDYKFDSTYFDFFEKHIVNEIIDQINLNSAVNEINYSSEKILIKTIDGSIKTCDKVILTLPITQYKKNSITFIPALPDEKVNALNKIGMGPGMKVFLKFNQAFYHDNIVGGAVCAAYANEKIGKVGQDNVLLAFIMGEQAKNLELLGSDSAIISALLSELDLMYNGIATSSFISGHVENWSEHPFIEGAYSYSTVNMGNARELASKPIDNKLFFAGEAMNLNGHHQTVFGAAETGYREVINILTT